MSDQALKNAVARRDALAAEINSYQQKIDDLRKEIVRAERFISDWNDFAGVNFSLDAASDDAAAPKNPDKELVGDNVDLLLELAGKPIKRAELMKELNNRGIVLHGKNPTMVLSTMLWRMQDRFVRIPRFGYWFRDQPYEPAGYVPGSIPNTLGKDTAELQESLEEIVGD